MKLLKFFLFFSLIVLSYPCFSSEIGAETLVRGQRIAGPLNPETILNMTIFFKPRNLKELEKRVNQMYDKKSSEYGKYLKPEEFDELYGVRKEDINKVESWLVSQGFHITKIKETGSGNIEFSGTAGQVSEVFKVEMVVNYSGEYLNVNEPVIPAELRDAGALIVGLDRTSFRRDSSRGDRVGRDI